MREPSLSANIKKESVLSRESLLPLIFISLVLGIITYITSKNLYFILPVIGIVFIILFLMRNSSYKKILIIIVIFLVGFINANMSEPTIKKEFLKPERDVKLTGTVLNYPTNKDKTASFVIKSGNYKILIKIKDNIKKDNKLLGTIEKGSIVKVIGKTEDVAKVFSDGSTYENYLLKLDCNGAVVCAEDGLLGVNPPKSIIQSMLNNMRSFFLKNFDKTSINDDFNSFLKAIVIGERDISFYNMERFSELGIVHFLSISGMHFNILGAFIIFLLIILGIKSPYKEIITISILTIFLLIVGFIAPAVRAYIMFSVAIIAPLIRRINDSFLGLCLASIILLLIDPWLLKNIGFELSFIGTFALIVAPPKILYKGLYASLATTPLVIYNFNILSFASILSNLLILPILPFFYIYGIFIAIFGFINLPYLNKLVNLFWKLFMLLSDKIASFSFSYKYVADINVIFILLFYSIFIAAGIFWFYSGKDNKKLVNQIIAVIAITPILFSFYPPTSSPQFLKVQFIDVGEGDSTFIRTPDGLNILIDGGRGKTEFSSYNYGERKVLPLLKRNGINKLDFIILSHYHDDHYGGLISILNHIPKVEKIILPKYKSSDRKAFDLLFNKLAKKPDVIYICGNKKLKVGKYTVFEFYSPSCDKDLISNFNENSKSIVLKLIYKQISILFAGDTEEDAEKWLINEYGEAIDSDILKAAHHGSKTSSSEAYLDTVTPEVAIISCGPPWIFNHPALSVVNRLNENYIDFYTTYENGDIILYTNGYKYKIFGLKP